MEKMTEARFVELAAAYGATLAHWPDDVRPQAKSLLETSLRARAVLEHERILDDALDAWQVPPPSNALMSRILGDAADVSFGQMPKALSAERTIPEPRKPGLMTRLFGDWGWRPAGAMTACLAIGFVAGMSGAPAPIDTTADLASAQEETLMDLAFFDDEETDLFGLETL